MPCINCSEESTNGTRLCDACRESSPFPEEQLESFLDVIKAFAPKEE